MHLIAVLAADIDLWQRPIWVADSTPVPCGMSRETVKGSELAGWAGYGYWAWHSRRFWGLRLHLVAIVQRLPVAFALTDAEQRRDRRREVLVDLVTLPPERVHHPGGLSLVAGKGNRDQYTETWLGERAITVVRRAYRRGAAAIWPHWYTGQLVMRSPVAYDH